MRRFALLGAAVAAAAVLASCSSGNGQVRAGALAARGAAADTARFGTITVSGHGTIDGTPDTLTLSIGVDTQAQTAVDALSENNTHAHALIATLKAAGIAERDIQTSQLSVNPVYDDKGKRITGYAASNHVSAKLHDLAKAGAVIDAATKAVGDAIRVDGVTFSIDDTSGLVAQARVQAVKKAAAQAKQLADAAGVELGRIKTIDETSREAPVPQFYAADAARSAVAAPIQPGTQVLSLDVEVVYEINQ